MLSSSETWVLPRIFQTTRSGEVHSQKKTDKANRNVVWSALARCCAAPPGPTASGPVGLPRVSAQQGRRFHRAAWPGRLTTICPCTLPPHRRLHREEGDSLPPGPGLPPPAPRGKRCRMKRHLGGGEGRGTRRFPAGNWHGQVGPVGSCQGQGLPANLSG